MYLELTLYDQHIIHWLVQIAVYQQVPVSLVVKAQDQRAGDCEFKSFTGGIPCLFFSKVSVCIYVFKIVFMSNV